MKKLEQMTKTELLQRVRALEQASPGANAAFEYERLLHELQVHQVELETQNRELREAQLRVESSRDRYADLYDFAPVGYVTLDGKGVIQELNLTAAGMLGGERARLVGVPFHLHVAREDLTQFREHLSRLEQPEERVVTELHLARKGGPPLLVVVQSVLYYDEERHRHLCRTSLTDITAGRQAEAALRESEARLRMSVQAANIGLWDWHVITNEVRLSAEWKSQLGYAEEEIPNRFEEWKDRLHPDDVARAMEKIGTFLADPRGRYEVEFRLRHKDGSYRWISAQGDVSRDAAGKPVRMLGCHIDITGRKELEMEIVRISGEERQRIAADLHDGICQELTGIRFVLGTVGRTLRQRADSLAPKLQEIEAALGAAAEHTRQVARGLYPVVAEVGGLAGALRALATTTAHNHGIRCTCVCPGPVHLADLTVANELYLIAQEAVRNAARHGRARRITIRLRQQGQEIHLAVQDNGCGLPPAAATSNGLGLRLMRYRAGLIHGQITIRPRPRGGTEVLCRLAAPPPRP